MDTEARLALLASVEKNHGVMQDIAEYIRVQKSMHRLTQVIPSVPIKDRTVVGTSIEIERMPLT